MASPGRCLWPALIVVLGFAISPGMTQAPEKPPLAPPADLSLVSDYVAAAQVVLSGNPLTAAAMRLEGYDKHVWGELHPAGDEAPALDARYLVDIKDGKPLPRFIWSLKHEMPREDWAVYAAYSDALVKSFNTPLDAFKKSASEFRHVTFAQLWATPDLYRGKVIRVQGRMVRLRKWDTVPRLAQDKGVRDLYEGWVFGPTRRSNPFCIVFPVLPPGLDVAEDMNRYVTFYGYFLTKFKYRGAKEDQVTPLLIGPTVVVEAQEASSTEESPFSLWVLRIVMGGLVALTVLGVILHFWFRRGDKQVLSTLDGIHAKHNPPNFENEPPGERPSPLRAYPVDRPPDPPLGNERN